MYVGFKGFPGRSSDKESACNAGGLGSIPSLVRSSGEGNDNPLQYSYLENPWTKEPGGLQFMRFARIRHNLVTKPPAPHEFIYTYTQIRLLRNYTDIVRLNRLRIGKGDCDD